MGSGFRVKGFRQLKMFADWTWGLGGHLSDWCVCLFWIGVQGLGVAGFGIWSFRCSSQAGEMRCMGLTLSFLLAHFAACGRSSMP